MTLLNSVVMDDTQAPHEIAETESQRAWSQEDPTEVITYRSWKLPLIAAAAVLGMIGAALYLTFPQENAPKPQVAPPAPQLGKPLTLDEQFLALDRQRLTLVSPKLAISAAHEVCAEHQNGVPDPELAQNILKGTPGLDLRSASIFVDTAREVYCP